MLETFTIDTFSGRVGETFRVVVDDTHELRTELVEAHTWGTDDDQRRQRVPFTLVFRGPGPVVLPQQTYTVQHEEMGEMEIFLVPIGSDAKGVRYEAVFA